jgi:hypothetical protein
VVSFTPGERVPGAHWIGGLVDPRTGLDEVEKRISVKICSRSDSIKLEAVWKELKTLRVQNNSD